MNPTYLVLDGNQAGPFSVEELRQFIAEGKVSAETPAWQEGMFDWTTVKAIIPDAFSGPPPFVPPVMPPVPPPPAKKGMNGCLLAFLIVCGVGVCFMLIGGCLAGVALGPMANVQKAKESMAMQQARSIDLMLFQYSIDNNGQYPQGKTSTEVFQKLLDEKYANDPSIFYVAMPGKTKPTSTTLTADNVCFDVTGGASSKSPENLPLVFLTGYTVTYVAGSSAICDNLGARLFPAIAVAYQGNSAKVLEALKTETSGDIPHFMPDDFTPGPEQYTQLRP